MPSRAQRYLDLLGEREAVSQLADEGEREKQLAALMQELWRDMSTDEREAVFKAVSE